MSVTKSTSKGKISCTRVFTNSFQKQGTQTAELKQVITTVSEYPSARVDNNLQQNIFDAIDCGFSSKTFSSDENRMAWIPVPANATVEQVQALLDKHYENGATIYRVLSSKPILSNDQKYAIAQGFKTLDDFADTQAVRYPDTNENKSKGIAGKLVKDGNGNPFYRKTFFWKTTMEDQDVRNTSDVYLSAKMKAELQGASVLEGQTI